MKNIYSTIILVLFAFISFAQTNDPKAEAVLNKLSEKAKTYKTVEASFTFTQIDKKAEEESIQEGKVKVKDEKYVLILGDFQIYNDGTITWTYDSDLNEATKDFTEDVRDPDSPTFSEMLTMWETGFTYQFDSESTLNGVTYQVINLFPTKASDKPYHTAKITVNKNKEEIVKIMLLGKDGIDYIYDLTTFKVNVPLSEDTFTPNLKALGLDDADIIDNTL
jgi:outer membrane lipoprotein-sorting protein